MNYIVNKAFPRFYSKVARNGGGGSLTGDMFKFLFTFGLGVYAGVYLSQNYNVPRVDEPAKVLDKVKDYLDEHKKK